VKTITMIPPRSFAHDTRSVADGPLTLRERALTERLAEAEEAIRQLRKHSLAVAMIQYRDICFTRSEACIINCLSDARMHSIQSLRTFLDAALGRVIIGTNASFAVTLCRLRRKLKRLAGPTEVLIDSHWGIGFSMSPASIAALRANEVPPPLSWPSQSADSGRGRHRDSNEDNTTNRLSPFDALPPRMRPHSTQVDV
jgi:hypothetical protein